MSRGRIVSFRIAEEHYALLVSRSMQGGSPGSLARELLLQALHDERGFNDLRTRIDQQRDQVLQVQRDLRIALRAALIAFGRLDPDRAKTWVGMVLR